MKKNLLILIITLIAPFLTLAQQAPINLSVQFVLSNSAVLQWEGGTCAQLDYVLAYKDSTLTDWDSVVVSNNGFGTQVENLPGLNPTTTYNWRVRCDTTWVNGPNFTTTSCFTFLYSVTGATCNGYSDGAIDLTVTGGQQPYTFSWSSYAFPWFGETTEDIDSLFSGTYVINVTDYNGCSETDSVMVTIIDTHSVNQTISDFTINPVTGYGQWTNTNLNLTNTGCDVNLRPEFLISHDSLNITHGDFDLQWYNPIIQFWASLAYDVNSNGDVYGIWHPTSNNPNPNANIDSTGWFVNEGQIQSVAIRVRFNNNPTNTANHGIYTCIWNTQEVDSAGNIIQSLAPADSIDISFANCAIFGIDSIITNNVLCYGNNDGSASINNINNGFGNYSYQWSTGDSLPSASNLSAGIYSVILSDLYSGCQDTSSFTIIDATPIQVNITGTDVSCNGDSNGTIIATPIGSGNFSYSWSPTLSNDSAHSNLSADTYTLTLYDSVCNQTIVSSYTINNPDTLSYYSLSLDNRSCDSTICNGLISAILSGGTMPYQYLWDDGSTFSGIQNLCAGSYSVIVTDANSCQTFYDTITIIDSIVSASINITQDNISCYGLTDGMATVLNTSGGNYGNVSLLNYCPSGPLGSNSVNIANIRLLGDNGNNINNNTSSYGDTYEDFTNQFASLTPNNNYSIRVDIGTMETNPLLNEFAGAKIYADWNTDGDFNDPGEEIGLINVDTVPFSSTLSFTVPPSLTGYVTRLRIAMQRNNDSIIGPCDSAYFDVNTFTIVGPPAGATEDYSLVVNVFQQPTYLWSTGETTQQINNLSAGTYSCILTDENSCVASDSVIISEPSQITDSLLYGTILCHGGFTWASLSINGGTPPYTESWSQNQNMLYAGTVNYSITDSSGCQVTNTFTLSEPSPSTLSIQVIDSISCFGVNDGSLSVTINGGNAPYTYQWTNNINSDTLTTDTITNLMSARYTCQVIDSNNCINSMIFLLSEPTQIMVNQNNTNITCYGDTNGVTVLNISGGDGNYTLNAFGQTLALLGSSTISSSQFFPGGIPAGIYPFSLSDGGGCVVNDTIIITQPNILSSTSNISNISCYGLVDGSVSLNISGGTPPFVEDWAGFNPNALSEGTYFFSVTDSNNCVVSDSATIIEPDSLSYTAIINQVSCYSLSDASVLFTISGGIAPYNQDWGSNNPLALAAGTYNYTISDTNGCSISDSVLITAPSELLVSIISSNILCYGGNNGTAMLTINGGTLPYTEDWYGADPLALTANTYQYTVTDTNGCFVSDSVTITQSQDSLSSSLIVTNMSSCLVSDGSIDQIIIGGTPPYTYLWNNGDTIEDINNLSAGTYNVTSIDSNGCYTSNSAFVDQPSDSLRLSLVSADYNGYSIACYGDTNGTISAITSGGNGPISYQWSTGDSNSVLTDLSIGSYALTITDTSGCSLTDSSTLISPTQFLSSYTTTDVLCYGDSTGSVTVTFSGGVTDYLLGWGGFSFPLLNGQNIFASGLIIPQGAYTYSATDLNGCAIFDMITINQPDSLYTSYTLSDYNGYNISCESGNDGEVDLTVNGGTSPFSIYFNSSQYSGSNLLLTGLNQGTYLDSIIDLNGCMYMENITLTEPTRLSSTTQLLNNVSCNNACNGSLSVLANGGVGPYNYIWNSDSTQISDTAYNLCAGTYTVITEDMNGCLSSSLDSVTQPNEIIVNLDSITDVLIYGGNTGNIYVTLNNPNSTVQYQWSGPNGFSANTDDISNLYGGTYVLNTTDSLACSLDTFIVDQPLSLSASLEYITNNICWGRNQGAIAINPDGGDSVYTYLWTGPNGYTSTDEDIDSLFSGTYTIELSDTTNTIAYTFDVLQNDEIIVYSTGAVADCYDGSALATAYGFGGTPPLETIWSNGDTGISTTLIVGTHAVTVIDVYGCSSTDSVVIEPGDSLSIFANATMISCYGLNNGVVELNVFNGGTPPYLYSNDSGATFQSSNTFYNLLPGNNLFTVSDNNGCLNNITVEITQPFELGVDVIFTNLQCYNDCDATATAIVDNGTQPYSYEWTDPNTQTNQTAIALCAGFYNVTVTDDNGCIATESVSILNPDPIIVNIWQYEDMLEATAGFVSYQWLDDQNNPISGEITNEFYPSSSGEYSVAVTDSNGCSMISYAISFNYTDISQYAELAINIYPNPTNNYLYIDGATIISEVEIYNALGDKVIYIANEMSAELLKIDLSQKTKGIYFVKIISGDKLINYKIILQ